ncbi:MAG: T9SS type A sorting domain-containing protein [Dysgonamonadaceae bacterium]|nr:T9SS type A sorting domain-containing protein [Dysgonamonadaceae bacterium]
MYNVNGTLAGNYNAAQISAGIDVSNLSSGVYVVSLQTGNGQVLNAKIVK